MWLHEIIKLLHSKENNQRKRWSIEWDTFDRRYIYIYGTFKN